MWGEFPKCGENYGGGQLQGSSGSIILGPGEFRVSSTGWGEDHSGLMWDEASSARPWYSNIMFKTWFSTWFIRAHVVIKGMDIHMLEDISGWQKYSLTMDW